MPQTCVEHLEVSAFTVPTDGRESDGTLEWEATTLVLVAACADGKAGLGFSYTDTAAAHLIEQKLGDEVCGADALDVAAAWERMVRSIRNLGRPGICSTAIAAVDTALWDLKARLLEIPLVQLFGRTRDSVPIYGSGGFTSYDVNRLQQQLRGWAADGITMVKMKIGRDPAADPHRVSAAREAIGPDVRLFVDANGAYDRKQALAMADEMCGADVTWFEEPVTSDDLDGLRLIRDRVPSTMDVTAGEYGYDLTYFRRMLDAGAVDVLQADATRCAGFTEFLRAGALCAAYHVPLSAHTAPNLHAHVGCALPALQHVEWFYDHARMEDMLFDGGLRPRDGTLTPDPDRAGNGLRLKGDAEAYRVYGPTELQA